MYNYNIEYWFLPSTIINVIAKKEKIELIFIQSIIGFSKNWCFFFFQKTSRLHLTKLTSNCDGRHLKKTTSKFWSFSFSNDDWYIIWLFYQQICFFKDNVIVTSFCKTKQCQSPYTSRKVTFFCIWVYRINSFSKIMMYFQRLTKKLRHNDVIIQNNAGHLVKTLFFLYDQCPGFSFFFIKRLQQKRVPNTSTLHTTTMFSFINEL